MYKKTIAIDFDGVIHKYSKGWHDGTAYDMPVEGAVDAIKTLMKSYAVFVCTTRNLQQVQEWFAACTDLGTEIINDDREFYNNDKLLGLSNRKLPAIAYIDDRGIRFTDWKDILNYF